MKGPFLEVPSLSYGEQIYRSRNMLIEGNNLEVLAALPSEQIDLIYTDPPYNTGKKFRYNDDWKSYRPCLMEERYVTEQDAGHHAPWINFMASRLRGMKRVLRPSGVIAISIGKKELFHLGVLMDAIFGEDNQLGIINWQKRYSPSNDAKHIADTTDYVLIYAKGRYSDQTPPASVEQSALLWGVGDPCFDPNRLKIGDVPLIPFPLSWYHIPFELGCQSWRYQQSGHNQEATKLLGAVMGGGHHLSTPKPLKLIEKIIQLWCPPNGVILDAFAGSGTTAHAIFDLNAKTHAERRFLLIERGNPEAQDMFTRTLTAERLRRVLSGDWASGPQPPLSGGFTFQCCAEGSTDRGDDVLSEKKVAS